MKWFRKSFLKTIHSDILNNNYHYCCKVQTWHKLFICWKDLKEVKENMNSKQLNGLSTYTCSFNWFDDKENRLEFLEECLKKF